MPPAHTTTIRQIARLLRLSFTNAPLTVGVLCLSVLAASLQLCSVWSLGRLLDTALTRRPGLLPGYALLVFATTCTSLILEWGNRRVRLRVRSLLDASLTRTTLTRIENIHVHQLPQVAPITLFQRLDDVARLANVSGGVFLDVIGDTVVGLCCLLFLFRKGFLAGIIISTACILSGLMSVRVQEHLNKSSEDARESNRAFHGHVVDVFNHLRLLKCYSAISFFRGITDALFERRLLMGLKRDREATNATAAIGSVSSIASILVLIAGSVLVQRGMWTSGTLLITWLLCGLSFRTVQGAGAIVQTLPEALIAQAQLDDLLSYEQEVTPSTPNTATEIQRDVALELSGVVLSYPESTTSVLRNVNLHLRSGMVLAIVGASGSGKTTLANIIAGIIPPSQGSVRLFDQEITEIPLSYLRACVTVVSQDSHILSVSAFDNIGFGYTQDQTSVEEAAKQAQADEFIRQWPDAYQTILGMHGRSLSGGQRQRIAIARALVRRSPILILDEATSNLDTTTERLVLESVIEKRRAQRLTTIIITHRLRTVENADQIAVVARGTVVSIGVHTELLTSCSVYASLYGAPGGAFNTHGDRLSEHAMVMTINR